MMRLLFGSQIWRLLRPEIAESTLRVPEGASPTIMRDLALARSAQWVAGWMILGNVLTTTLLFLSRLQGGPFKDENLGTLISIDAVLAIIGMTLFWRVRRGPARWPIIVLIVWLVVETVGKATGPRPVGAVVDVIFLFVAFRALAAAQALHRAHWNLKAGA